MTFDLDNLPPEGFFVRSFSETFDGITVKATFVNPSDKITSETLSRMLRDFVHGLRSLDHS